MARMIATHEPEIVTLDDQPLVACSNFRENVNRIRREQQVSYGVLAERITAMGKHATEESVRGWMTHGSPRVETVELLARALGVSVLDLLS